MSSVVYGQNSRQLADIATQSVIAQIQQATTQGPTVAWASQPGMIRTYNNRGTASGWYKLYSAATNYVATPRADARQLHVEDRVGAVVEDHRGDVELLARHRPQRLDRVHGRAVGLEREHRTVRAGHRRADGTGRPWPIAPPVSVSSRGAGARRCAAASVRPEVLRLVGDDRALGQHARRSPGRPSRRSARRSGGRARGATPGAPGPDAEPRSSASASASSAPTRRRRRRQLVHLAAVGHQVALLARVGEERHRRLGVDEDQVLEAAELRRGELGEVGEPLDGRAGRRRARAASGNLGEQLRAGGGGDPRRPATSASSRSARPPSRIAVRCRPGAPAATCDDGLGGRRRRRGGRRRGRRARRRRPRTRRRAGSASRPGRADPGRRRPRRRRRAPASSVLCEVRTQR